MPAVIIVSLIDILAILLIFVIVTTTFRRDQPAVVIKLPESKHRGSHGRSRRPRHPLHHGAKRKFPG